jgi:hypothetical protein
VDEAALQKEFDRLVELWHRDTGGISSLTVILASPYYKSIVGMGWPVVPLILGSLAREPSFLICALGEITGERPDVAKEDYGRIDKITQLWLDWGRTKEIKFE